MLRCLRISAPALAATAFILASCPRPGSAAARATVAIDQAIPAWMSTVSFFAEDEDEGDRDDGPRHGERGRGERDHGRGEAGRGGEHGRGAHASGGRGPGARGPAPRIVAGPGGGAAKLDEILARLARIEAKLDGRTGGPPRGEWRGPRPPEGGPGPRPEAAERGRRMMGERMGEGGPRPDGRPPVPEEMREQMRRRMEEGRERMEQARNKLREMEERISKLEAEIERLRADR